MPTPVSRVAHLQDARGTFALMVWLALIRFTVTAEPAPATSFRTSILPLLTKAGCNAGACHGAATGQGGFKLSLLGYDPEEDHARITRELAGRRIDRVAPEESLLLRKPSGRLEHEGGRKLPRDSAAYQKLRDWIATGAPYGPSNLRVTAIEVSPADSFLPATNRAVSLLRVMATLSDGSREDVTALTLYSSNDDALASVDKQGVINVAGRGVTSIMARYGGQVAAARVSVPFSDVPLAGNPEPGENLIDQHINNELRRLRLPRSPLSDDAEFLRRVTLDLAGRLPTPERVRAFLAEPASTAKRSRVIEELLHGDDFVDLWTMRLADLLLVGGKKAGAEAATRVYHAWLREQVATNAPVDQLAQSLLTATGEVTKNGPANFYTLASDPRDMAEHAGRIFLGARIGCARCHAHPADRWTREDYHRFAAYFARVSREGGAIRVSNRGEVDDPKTGEPLSPRPLGVSAPAAKPGDTTDRREELARWLTSPDDPRFGRAMVNRVWKYLLGRGLVEPVDDLRPTNPATHPALLDESARDFVTHGHDLRRLIRDIVSTQAYQRSSRSKAGNQSDDRFYSHALLKELPAAVFLDAVAQATGVPDAFGELETARAVQLVDAHTPSYALDVLGRCSRDTPCDTVSRAGGGLALALHLINGPTINAKLAGGALADGLARSLANRQLIEELYLRALGRLPGLAETTEWERLLARPGDRQEAAQDLLWTLLNSREFAFNH